MVPFGKKLMALVIIFILRQIAFPSDICVNTYAPQTNGEFKSVNAVFVDLDDKSIMASLILADQGEIVTKMPVQLELRGMQILLTAINQGCYCANTSVGNRRTRLVFLDRQTQQLRFIYDDTTLSISTLQQYGTNRIILRASSELSNMDSLYGSFNLQNNYRLRELIHFPADYSYGYYGRIAQFWPIMGVDTTFQIYSNIFNNQLFLIKSDPLRHTVLDSIKTGNMYNEADIYAVKDSILFLFRLNCERHNGYSDKDFGENWIESHVKRYDASTMAYLDSMPIDDYPRGEYVANEHGNAEVVGPYIVYYFFYQESMENNSPAMLFIFDTRTNEATWLRVGWR